ncbi:DUF5719 family protein [Agrococcus sp. Ld7]|uniref:DUF5719 family protein n=1 Tax=Agrococcus sp. Ld7 TaxID=649148 RepID=UPI0038630CE2
MTHGRDHDPLDDSQEFDDPSPIAEEEAPSNHRAAPEERAVEAEAESSGDIASDVTLTDREAAANEAAEAGRRFERRDVVRWSARALGGVAVAGIIVGAVLGATALPDDIRVQTPVPESLVQPSSPLQSRVCAGPALRVGTSDGEDALAIAALGDPVIEIGSLGGEIRRDAVAVTGADDVPGGVSVVQRNEETTLSAAQTLALDVEAVRGFAASECAETRLDQWLVGGSTRTGRQTVLTVANASEASASVDVTVFGSDGAVESVGSSGIAVSPGSSIVLDLAAIAPGVPDAVVRVASTGAPVAAHLQQITTRGLERGGFEVVDPVAALTSTVLPGVTVTEPTGLETREGYDDTVPTLRLLSPTGGDVRVVFQEADGSTIESAGVLEAGRVTDFPLEELPTGTFAISVESDAPVVAGARSVAVAGEGLDFDWIAGGQARTGTSAVAVPSGPNATVHIVSTADADQEIEVAGRAVQLAANGVHEQRVEGGSIEVSGEGLVIGIGYRDEGRVGGFTASPQGPSAEGVRVLH